MEKESDASRSEKIMDECYQLYIRENTGLIDIGKRISIDFHPPRKEVVILLLGNHSAGKSSLINWYIGDNVQKTGVAIETQGFTFIKQGDRRETLLADAALHVLPRFGDLKAIKGVMNYVNMELSTSRERKFNLVTFIDSPGLVDGGMEYPFDVNQALLQLGQQADLVFVFFDPIGQALCRRTLTVLEQLSAVRGEGIRYFLSKADDTGSESDRQKVLTQIVQELCRVPGVNRQGFEIKSIYIPDRARGSKGANHLEEVCQEVEKTVQFAVQKALSGLRNDCDKLEDQINLTMEQKKCNFQVHIMSFLLVVVGVVTHPIFLLAGLLIFSVSYLFLDGMRLSNVIERHKLKKLLNCVKLIKLRRDQLMIEYLQQSVTQPLRQ